MGIMKNNMSTNVRKLIIRYSPLLLLAVMLSFILSKLIVIGSEIISNSINVMISGEQIYMKELFLKMGMIIIISMIVGPAMPAAGDNLHRMGETRAATTMNDPLLDYQWHFDNPGPTQIFSQPTKS